MKWLQQATVSLGLAARLHPTTYVKTLLANTGWLFIDRIVRIGIGLLVNIWVARHLGPEQFGLLSYTWAFVAMFAAVASVGLDSVVIRDIVRDPNRSPETLGTAFFLKLIGALAAFVAAIAAIFILHPADTLTHWLVVIVAAGMILQPFDTIDFWFQSQVQSKYVVWSRNTAFLAISAAKVSLILLRAPLIAFALAGLAEATLAAFGLVTAYQLTGHNIMKWHITTTRARELLSASWPLLLSALAIAIYMQISQVMLGEIAGPTELGIYSAASRISTAWYFIPSAIVGSLFPTIVKSKGLSQHDYYRNIHRLFNLMTLLAYAVALPITVLSDRIVALLYGDRFAGAGLVLAVLIWAGLFVSLGVARESWTVTEGLMKFSLASTVAGAAVSIVLNRLLIPGYGPLGAAVATLLAQFTAVTLSTLFYQRTRRIFRMQVSSILLFRIIRP